MTNKFGLLIIYYMATESTTLSLFSFRVPVGGAYNVFTVPDTMVYNIVIEQDISKYITYINDAIVECDDSLSHTNI